MTLEEVKLYLKVENDEEDFLIQQLKETLYHLLLADRKDVF